MFWDKHEIRKRNFMKEVFSDEIESLLRSENRAWHFFEIEAPLLIPKNIVNPNYTNEDIWVQEKFNDEDLVLRPETTPSTYTYACHMLNSNMIVPPFCVYQSGKSFRREQDQVTKNMRLKEFYQQEFQCIYG